MSLKQPDDIIEPMKRAKEEAINRFVRITQKDMKQESEQQDDLLKTLSEGEFRLVPFMCKQIRSMFHENAWWFSVVDVIETIAENENRPSKYWFDLKRKVEKEGFSEISEKIGKLKMPAAASTP